MDFWMCGRKRITYWGCCVEDLMLLSALKLAPEPQHVSAYFESEDDYAGFVEDPGRITRLEWRKMRRSESRGLTSHSWLEAYLLDGTRRKLEIYSDMGYTESIRHSSHEIQGTLYENRAAEMPDFVDQLLNFEQLSDIAREVAAAHPYALSEFNCHHFVLKVWNSVVVDSMQATHYPDRAKLGLLWSLEGTVGTWVEGLRGTLGGREQEAVETSSISLPRRLFKAVPRDAPEYDVRLRYRNFKDALDGGIVFLLTPENSRELCLTRRQPASMAHGMVDAWATEYLRGATSVAYSVAERIGRGDISDLVSKLGRAQTADVSAGNNSALNFLGSVASFNSVASLGSLSTASASLGPFSGVGAVSYCPPSDVCFVVLHTPETRCRPSILHSSEAESSSNSPGQTRLVTYAILQSASDTSHVSCLRVLSGNAADGQEAISTFSQCEVPEGIITAFGLVNEDLPNLQLAVRTGDFDTFLGGWRKVGRRNHVHSMRSEDGAADANTLLG
jgi:hypothetical protein